MIYLGIDFGTSNSCIAYYDSSTGEKKVIKPRIDELALKGGYVTPSVVALDQNGNLISAGHFAISCGQVMGSVVIDKVKQWIGLPFREVHNDYRLKNLGYEITPSDEGYPVIKAGDRTYTAENIAAFFLQYLISEAEVSLKKRYKFSDETVELIVTYPAYYLQNQVDAIREAVYQAVEIINRKYEKELGNGISISGFRIIPEPLASVCAAIADNKIGRDDNYILIIDEGAGTLDVMLVNIASSNLDQVSISRTSVIEAQGITIGGMERLGGVDMDNDIFSWIQYEMKKKNVDFNLFNPLEMKQLMTNIEDGKISLGMGRTNEVLIGIPAVCQVLPLSSTTLEELLEGTITRCQTAVASAICQIEKDHPEFTRNDISKVILIGGPTQMNLFKSKMYEYIGIHPVEGINPMEYVALGAAVSPSVRYSVPVERTYGLIKNTGDIEEFESIIKKDTVLPAVEIIDYPIHRFEGKIAIEVAQIYDENPSEIICKKMGRYEFLVPPDKTMFNLIFKIDEERRIEVAITESQEKATNFALGIVDPSIYRLEFSRASFHIPTVISKKKEIVDVQTIDIIRKNAPTLFNNLGKAVEQMREAEMVLSYNLDPGKRQIIDDLKKDIEIYSNILWHNIQDIIDNFQPAGGSDMQQSIAEIRQIEFEIRNSEDLKILISKTSSLKEEIRKVQDMIRHGKGAILELLEQISRTQTKTIEITRKRGNVISENKRNEIDKLMTELDSLKEHLERKMHDDILVCSTDGSVYRESANKEQMLKCIIDQMV